jgi:hypothetical protein
LKEVCKISSGTYMDLKNFLMAKINEYFYKSNHHHLGGFFMSYLFSKCYCFFISISYIEIRTIRRSIQ